MMTLNQLFKKLVSIDSPSGEEKDMSDFIMDYLHNLNLKPNQDKKWMIYCRVGQKPNPILFACHMDTVEPGRNIKAIIKDGYICTDKKTILGGDNKLSIAAVLYNVSKLFHEKKEINIELIFSVREETNNGIQDFDRKKIKSKVGFVFDLANQGVGAAVLKAPVIYDFKASIHGREAHASRPERGVNALDFFLKLGPKLKLGRPDKDTTFNIGLIRGGSATNTVPGQVTLAGDLRSLNPSRFQKNKYHIENAFKNMAEKSKVKIIVEWLPYSHGYNIPKTDKHYKQLKSIYRNLKVDLKPIVSTGGSDAGFLNHVGVKTFCLADGLIDTHTVNERIKVRDFEKISEIIKTIMLEYKL